MRWTAEDNLGSIALWSFTLFTLAIMVLILFRTRGRSSLQRAVIDALFLLAFFAGMVIIVVMLGEFMLDVQEWLCIMVGLPLIAISYFVFQYFSLRLSEAIWGNLYRRHRGKLSGTRIGKLLDKLMKYLSGGKEEPQ